MININGFAKTGICPLHPYIFTDLGYISAEATDIEVENKAVETSVSITEVPLQATMQEPLETTLQHTTQEVTQKSPPVLQMSREVTPPALTAPRRAADN